jgi:glycosyltransferase involved in cell wall biosynthesis
MPIRVVRIIDRLNIGGPAKHVTWLTAGLNSGQFESTLITGTVPASEGDMNYFAREAGVEPLVIAEMSREIGPRDLIVVWKVYKELRRVKPHILHTHKAKAGAVGRSAAFFYNLLKPASARCRTVHTFHGHVFHSYYTPLKSKIFIQIERLLARHATDRIITISDEQKREITGDFGVGDATKVAVIPLGIDLTEIKPDLGRLRSDLGLGDDVFLLGIVGRLCEVKNHSLLLDSAARLAQQGIDPAKFRVLIIGDGELRTELERKTRELGIEGHVVFTGFRKDAGRLYADLDLVALTSLNEGTPVTLIEAMCAGRAVIATEVGGVRDLMGEFEATDRGISIWSHGVTTASRDADRFADGIRYLYERPELRQKMGARASAFVKNRLSKDRLIREIESLYRQVLGGSTCAF